MKPFDGYDKAKEQAKYVGGEKLPVGAYVAKILGVAFEAGKPKQNNPNEIGSDTLIVQYDICEGEYADFFRKQYDNNPSEDRKFKGRTTIYLPKDDGSEQDGWTKNSFAKWTVALEESNSGYAWDWDEKKWKDKLIGLVFGETGTVIDGKEVTYTELRFPVSVETVRSGKAPEGKFKAKNGWTGTGAKTEEGPTDFMSISADIDEELPFK